jgi:hypothetical protein
MSTIVENSSTVDIAIVSFGMQLCIVLCGQYGGSRTAKLLKAWKDLTLN